SLLFEIPGGAGWRQAVILVSRVILAAVFIYAALQKIDKPLMFADEIAMYGILGPGPLLNLFAIVLPWIELTCGLALLTGVFMRGAALILAVMNLVFIVVISYRTAGIMSAEGTPLKQVYFDCGCGFGATYAWKKLIEDAALLVLSVTILLSPAYRYVVGRRKG
ncbi:MAG TPA: DoxX family protein, partial [Candidatus Eisenbacteria bacterium]|nr:DoxX family protein [Candidatus Eisenbacteria bacterium]